MGQLTSPAPSAPRNIAVSLSKPTGFDFLTNPVGQNTLGFEAG